MSAASNPTARATKTFSFKQLSAGTPEPEAEEDEDNRKTPESDGDGSSKQLELVEGAPVLRTFHGRCPAADVEKWDVTAWKRGLKEAGLKPIKPIPVNMKKKAAFGLPKNVTVVTQVMNFVKVRPDVFPFMAMQQQGVDWKEVRDMNELDQGVLLEEINAFLDAAEHHVMSSGTKEGLMNRLKLMTRPKPEWKFAIKDYEKIVRGLGVKTTALPDFTKLALEDVDWVDVKVGADAGAPWASGTLRTEQVAKQAFAIAKEMLNYVAKNKTGFEGYFKANPEMNVLRMKNKFEMGDVSDYLTKARPYYVLGTHLFLLFATIIRPIEIQMACFTEDDESHSAYKFVWQAGGAQKLMEFVLGGHRKMWKYHDWIMFGDDQLVAIRFKSGNRYVMAPDVRAMDMSLGTNALPWLKAFMLGCYKGKLNGVWKEVVSLYVEMMCKCKVAVHSSVTVEKTRGWNSGMSGITTAEMAAQEWVYQHETKEIAALVEKTELKDEPAVLAEIVAKYRGFKEKYGLEFKEETLKVYKSDDLESVGEDTHVTKWKFLGCGVMVDTTDDDLKMYPAGDSKKIFASACWPALIGKKAVEGIVSMPVKKARAFGLLLAGGWQVPVLGTTLRAVYSHYEKLGIKMSPDESWVNFPSVSEYDFTEDPDCPTDEQLVEFFSNPAAPDLLEALGGVKKGNKVKVENRVGAAEVKAARSAVAAAAEYKSKGGKKSWFEDTAGEDGDAAMKAVDAEFGLGGEVVDVKIDKKSTHVSAQASEPASDKMGTPAHPAVAAEHDARHKALLAKGQGRSAGAAEAVKKKKGSAKLDAFFKRGSEVDDRDDDDNGAEEDTVHTVVDSMLDVQVAKDQAAEDRAKDKKEKLREEDEEREERARIEKEARVAEFFNNKQG